MHSAFTLSQGLETGKKFIFGGLIIPLKLIPPVLFTLNNHFTYQSTVAIKWKPLKLSTSPYWHFFQMGEGSWAYTPQAFSSPYDKIFKSCKWDYIPHHRWKFTQSSNTDYFFQILAVVYPKTLENWSKNKPRHVQKKSAIAFINI